MTQKIKLLADHTHAGMKFKKDATITVDDASADWLVDNKVAEKGASSFDKPALAAPASTTPDTK